MIGLALILLISPLVQAQGLLDDEMDYDSIVESLGATTRAPLEDTDPLANVLLHASLGLASSYISIEPELGSGRSGFLKGIEASFGIDLFSRQWQAEGSVRSFNNDRIDRSTEIGLKEFDLKFLYLGALTRGVKFRTGAGLAARYLNVVNSGATPLTAQSTYTTPASIFFGGMAAQITRNLSIGADLSLRTALIKETVDKSAVGASLRIDAQF